MRRLPAHILNGLTVAVGVACIRVVIGLLAGATAAQLALSGTIGASLADVPNTAGRNVRRVFLAATLSVLASVLIALLRQHPVALGVAIAVASGLAMLLTAWGTPANALSFAPVLVMVFSLAAPADPSLPLRAALWNAVGAVCYLGWSLLTSRLLEGRYRTLAVAQALASSGQQLRARAGILESPASGQGSDGMALRGWVAAEAVLAESLQGARDLVYAAPSDADYPRNVALLQHLLELRDQLVTSQLDLHLFGTDAAAQTVRQRITAGLRRMAIVLDDAAAALRRGPDNGAPPDAALGEAEWFAGVSLAAADPRARLLTSVVNRQRHLAHEVRRVHALLHGGREGARLGNADLQRFMSPESWQLLDLRQQLNWQSPVLRHALRTAVALGSAYFIGRALPWASHPHWLVLSVAVVLRGNLEQTLARRNMRVAGTLLGCAAVVALMAAHSQWLFDLSFVLAVAIAHGFATRRYWLAATAATVMALLQAHLVDPAGGLPVAERAADTLLGALLAWGFSYVLPSWERRRLPRALTRALENLNRYAARTLADLGDRVVLEQRLARQRAYESLHGLGTLLQRSSAEPRSVRVPDAELVRLLDHAQRFMAHLSMVRLTLTRRTADLSTARVEPLLADTVTVLAACLDLRQAPSAATIAPSPDDLQNLPSESPDEDVHPWLQRRLQRLISEALLIRGAAESILARAGGNRPRSRP